MEFMLQAVVVVFMLFLCALCLFAVVVIARDIVRESANSKREKETTNESDKKVEPVQVVVQPIMPQTLPAEPAQEVEEPKAEPEEVKEEPKEEPKQEVEEEIAVTQEVAEEDPDAVSFSRVNLTMEEKYEMLSTEFKRYFDEIVKHALSKEGVSESKRTSSYDYKIGAYRVVKMMIKRGEIVCEFNFIERDFKNYANEASVKVKQLGTAVRVTETSAVGVVKDGIDLVITQIAQDKEYKKNLAREKRREKRRQEREENKEENK